MSLNEVKTAFPKIYNLAAVVVTFGLSTTVCECSFSILTRVDAPQRRLMLLPRQRHLVLLAFERDRTRKSIYLYCRCLCIAVQYASHEIAFVLKIFWCLMNL